MSRRSVALLWPFVASAGGLGCGLFGPPYHLAADAPPSSRFERLVLLPANFDRAPSPAIAPGAEVVRQRIRSHLESLGYEVPEPRMSATLELWKECTEAVGGIAQRQGKEVDEERYEKARSELVRRTLATLPADGAVAVTVMIRPARYSGKELHWDGVARPVSIENKTNMPVLYLRGKDVGTSLRVTVFDDEGRKIFERYVGLEPLRRFEAGYPSVRPVARTDLFQDADLLESSIALSFQPWLHTATPEEP